MRLRLIKTSNGALDPLLSFTADYTKEVIILAVLFSLFVPVLLYIIFRNEKIVAWSMVVFAILTMLIVMFLLPD